MLSVAEGQVVLKIGDRIEVTPPGRLGLQRRADQSARPPDLGGEGGRAKRPARCRSISPI